MYKITTRPATDDERRIIRDQARFDIASLGCLTIVLGIVPAVAFGWLGGWIGSFLSPDLAAIGRYIGWALSAVIYCSALLSFVPYARRQHKRASEDFEDSIVQQVSVSTTRVVEIGLIDDNEPILAFDMGGDKILFLRGQWLYDPATFGADSKTSDDAHEDFLNCLPAPHSFPSSRFTIHRLPHSGRVLTIQVAGNYLAPDRTVEALKPEYEFGDSEIFDG